MTVEEIYDYAVSEEASKEFHCFEKVENKLSNRADLHAFLLLDKICPVDDGEIITAAEHDIIYLGIDMESFAKVATKEILVELTRCGVIFDSSEECLIMYA